MTGPRPIPPRVLPPRVDPRPATPARVSIGPGLLIAAASVYVVIVAWALDNTSFDVWGGLLLAPVLVTLTLPLARRVARRENDVGMARFILAALILKLGASLVRYAVAFQVYDGVADAEGYHKAGSALAAAFRQGIFDFGDEQIVGTTFMEILTGIVYSFTGPTKIGGFLVFAWIGFWGLYFFYRAFRIAIPEGNHRRYARLVFLLPSMLFWPSSIGKEAWMTLTIGLTCLGAAKLFTARRGAYVTLAAGAAGTAMVRPHITLILTVATTAGMLVRRTGKKRPLGPLATAVAVLILAAGGIVAVTQVERFFKVDSLDGQSVDSVLDRTQNRTAQGGSSFQGGGDFSPSQLPNALVTMLFRPFPTEARNFQMVIASLEGMLLLVFIWRGRRTLLGLPRELLRTSYAAFALCHVLVFSLAFSSVENFGILARQRVQMFPLLLVLLALPDRNAPPAPTAPVDPPERRLAHALVSGGSR